MLFGIPYLKENVPNYHAEALSSLQTLYLFQKDYRAAHGTYARSLAELGVPLGAELVGERLRWDRYTFEITDLTADSAGHVIGYRIIAQPMKLGKRGYVIDQSGNFKPLVETR